MKILIILSYQKVKQLSIKMKSKMQKINMNKMMMKKGKCLRLSVFITLV